MLSEDVALNVISISNSNRRSVRALFFSPLLYLLHAETRLQSRRAAMSNGLLPTRGVLTHSLVFIAGVR